MCNLIEFKCHYYIIKNYYIIIYGEEKSQKFVHDTSHDTNI